MEELIRQLKPGDLTALFYQTKTEQLDFLIPFLKQGLEQNQRCLYIADDLPVHMILTKLQQAGVDVGAAQSSGALQVLTKAETYFREGQFDSEKMVVDLCVEVQRSLQMGFIGLRGSGDMGWALGSETTLKSMVEYQRRLFEIFPRHFLAVCQYDEVRFPPSILDGMRSFHDVEIRNAVMTRRDVQNTTFVSRAAEFALIMLKSGVPKNQILSRLASEAELVAGGGAVSSILMLDENGLLRNAASPSLPDDYLIAIDRLKPDPEVGTCASAAATGEMVITRDFFADEKWGELRHLPTALGFIGAWSMPIKTASGRVIGTFGTYYRSRRIPTEKEQRAVARLAEAAALVLS